MRTGPASRALALFVLALSPTLVAAQQQTPTPPGAPEPHRPPRPAPSKPPAKAPEIPQFPDQSNRQASVQRLPLPKLPEIAGNRVNWKEASVFVLLLYALYVGGRWLLERIRRGRGAKK